MLLRLINHTQKTHVIISKIQKYSSISNSQGKFQRPTTNMSVWFVKLVCTLTVRRKSSVKEFRVSDYLRKNMTSSIAFSVIHHMNCYWNDPHLAFGFLEYSKNVLNIGHTVDTYSFLLDSFCRLGVFDLAKKVYDLMRVDGFLLPDCVLLGFVVTSFVNAGNFEVAKELIFDYCREGVGNGGVLSFVVINRFLRLLVNSNRVNEAFEYLENVILRSKCCSVDACSFNIVINGLCGVREVDKAFGFLDKMREFGCMPDLVTYNTLMKGFCLVGNVDKAHKLLKDVCSVEGCSPDVVTFTSVIKGYCKLGKMEEAMVLFDDMMDQGIRPNTVTFNVMIDGFGKIGNMVSALNMYERMLSLGCNPDVITFTSIIDGHCLVGELPRGLKVWDEMNRRNISPNLHTFSILIRSLCRESRLNEARDLLRQLKRRDDIVSKAFVYNFVIDGFCKAGNVDEANVIVKEMEEKRCKPDKMTFTILIIGHCMKGRMIEAISLFDNMLIVGCAPDSLTVNSLVSRLLKAGMPKEASKIRKAASATRVPQGDASNCKNIDIPVAV
uniref:pentatricopeptide repeat-containing protein At2g06000-like n=1 Tax=Erigeron canadensis TaxID=72917 RepID=UPI001CB954BA|nr:pentatricopeptide repeat-containing protein At2g06000-like [Erigeron canadensis]